MLECNLHNPYCFRFTPGKRLLSGLIKNFDCSGREMNVAFRENLGKSSVDSIIQGVLVAIKRSLLFLGYPLTRKQ